ncbi:ChaN family lipoprotein [Reichenbachiella versicolor]|uniref:ChaN family lipoprotein n=1 Tax=Reichenbachiella versicolor TaxID=1821036 RepID=UPI000D6E9959|nr:ChaN family lipoprotein [Reichenbachiella versicolor]
MKQIFLFTFYFVLLGVSQISAQALQAYQIFDSEGKTTDFGQMAEALKDYDIVFFGEQHNNPIAHWLQIELTMSLYDKKNGNLILGAEMFERDAQLVLNEYLSGFVKESHLIKDGKAWNNYKTDYAPLVDFAKEKSLPFYATNVPRRYASMVAKKGIAILDTLNKEAKKKLLPPLPITIPELESYEEMRAMMGHGHGMKMNADNFIAAQAIKDATMGYYIVQGMKENKGTTMIHFNGNFHSKNHEGTAWYVKNYNKKLKVAVISFVSQEDISAVDDLNKGTNDFTIVCPANMTQTNH